MYHKIGEMVRYYRKKNGLTQRKLAEKAGVGKTVIFDIEHGKPSVQFNTLVNILNALDISLLFRSPVADITFKD